MSGNKCSYTNCGKSQRQFPNVRMHRFPIKNESRCKQWVLNSGNAQLAMLQPEELRRRYICGEHFEESAYRPWKNRLYIDAVPRPYSSQESPALPIKIDEAELPIMPSPSASSYASKRPRLQSTVVSSQNLPSLNIGQPTFYQDKGVQLKSGDLFTSFTAKIANEKHLKTLTGLSSFKVLNNICSFLAEYSSVCRSCGLSVQDRVVLVFMKLKMAVNFNVLAICFHITPATCKETFNAYLEYLVNVLSSDIICPSIKIENI